MEKDISLEQIYSLYMKDLYQYIFSLCKNKSLAEDIVQETFYRAYFYIDSYQEEKIKPWLFKVANHTFIDVIRKEKRITYYEDLDHLIERQVKSAEQEYLLKDRLDHWFKALASLSVSKRNVVLLRDYYRFSYQEIADIFDISIAKVKVSIYRGRKEVEKKMAEEYEYKGDEELGL
ncbi:RNA polymerase sigma factor [Halalkalibacter okhensis]|uniref:RNA polymerase sigma factor n=1 Tax=Halalkalibacter okhensis TaxID=333138 RepID=UPI0006900AEC|nr:RNA polymerase sigma factor [Halalkalibacter okhensis]